MVGDVAPAHATDNAAKVVSRCIVVPNDLLVGDDYLICYIC